MSTIIENTNSNPDLAHQSEGRELNGRATLLSNETLTFEPDSKAEGLINVNTSPNFPSPLVHQDEISIDSDGCNNNDSNHSSPYGSRCSSINNFGDVISSTVVSANISSSNFINRSKTDKHFAEWENMLQRETELLVRLKKLVYGTNLFNTQHDTEMATQDSLFESDLNTFLQQKSILLQTYETQLLKKEVKSPKQCEAESICKSPTPEMTANQPVLFVVQQPPDIVIANRYISPPPILEIRSNGIESEKGRNRTFIITVSLCYNQLNTPVQEISKTIDKKQDILQGIRRLTLSLSNQSPKTRQTYVSTTFPKLKVTEVTSKHKHQSFCLLFTLEEYSPSGECIVLHKIRTSPFQVLSRPSARSDNNGKRKADSEGSEGTSPPKHKTVKVSAVMSSPPSNESGLIPDAPVTHHAQMESMHLQDITELLTLPQKEAAHRLGISESMLCKRFKESTQRKWPYRYLLKLDKVIKILESQERDGTISEDDRMKLSKLASERVQCLHPVKIRISPNDAILNLNNNNNNISNNEKKQNTSPINALSSLASQSFIQNTDSHSASSEDKDSDSESEDQDLESHEEFLLETLELLKSQKPVHSAAQPQAVM